MKNPIISPNFLVWKFSGNKTAFPQKFLIRKLHEITDVFRCFQGMQKETSGMKWVICLEISAETYRFKALVLVVEAYLAKC